MAEDLRANCQRILEIVSQVETRAPMVVEDYRRRLQERMTQLLGPACTALRAEDILKEASLFAERSDISEELVRLRSHVQQFQGVLRKGGEEAPGRQLDFLTQEMLREVNTMGSKANDVEISPRVSSTLNTKVPGRRADCPAMFSAAMRACSTASG